MYFNTNVVGTLTTSTSSPRPFGRPRPPPASRRRPPAGPEPPPGQLGSLGAGGATHTQLASRPGRRRPREPVRAAAWRPVLRLALRTCTVPAKTPVAALHPRRHQPARTARPDPAHQARHRAALRRLQGPRRRAHADLRGRDDRQPTDLPPEEAPATAQEAPAAGRVPR